MHKVLRSILRSFLALFVALGLTACAPILPPGTVDPPQADPPGTTDPPQVDPPPAEVVAVQTLDYAESTATLLNPDQGFYIPLSVAVTADGITYDPSVIDTANLYHLRIDISAYSAKNAGGTDRPLSKAALDGIAALLDLLHERDKNAVVRFCYAPGFGAAANCEPSLENMVGHAKQFLAVLDARPTAVTAVEVGMVGPWGEMHTSDMLKDPAIINTLIDTFLENTTLLPVLVRTPQMIYNYLKVPDHLAITRLGVFNDGYLGSETDLGTYADRETDVAFISGQTAHLPFGGEVTVPTSTLHNIEVCLPEMYRIHLSYLNERWNDQVVAKWKKTSVTADCAAADPLYYGKTAYAYIQNHMGYRFVLKKSTFTYTDAFDELKIALALENVGFGNLNKSKKAEILLVSEKGSIAVKKAVENFGGESAVDYTVPLPNDLAKGTYQVYIRLYGDTWNGAPRYALQFANNGIYDATLSANRIGVLEIA